MKQLIVFILTFLMAYAATLLLDIDFIAESYIRIGLTILLIICIILMGANIIRSINKSKIEKK